MLCKARSETRLYTYSNGSNIIQIFDTYLNIQFLNIDTVLMNLRNRDYYSTFHSKFAYVIYVIFVYFIFLF